MPPPVLLDCFIRLLLGKRVAFYPVGSIGAFLFGVLPQPVYDRSRKPHSRNLISVFIDFRYVFQYFIFGNGQTLTGLEIMEILTYHCLAIGFIAMTLRKSGKPEKGKGKVKDVINFPEKYWNKVKKLDIDKL